MGRIVLSFTPTFVLSYWKFYSTPIYLRLCTLLPSWLIRFIINKELAHKCLDLFFRLFVTLSSSMLSFQYALAFSNDQYVFMLTVNLKSPQIRMKNWMECAWNWWLSFCCAFLLTFNVNALHALKRLPMQTERFDIHTLNSIKVNPFPDNKNHTNIDWYGSCTSDNFLSSYLIIDHGSLCGYCFFLPMNKIFGMTSGTTTFYIVQHKYRNHWLF